MTQASNTFKPIMKGLVQIMVWALIFVAISRFSLRHSYDEKLTPVGQSAPAFSLPSPTGKQVALSATLKGKKALLLNFWFYS
jgi:hypothetical protein